MPARVSPQRLFDPGQDYRHGFFHAHVLAVGRAEPPHALSKHVQACRLRSCPMWKAWDLPS